MTDENGNGHTNGERAGRYSAQVFIDAMPGTGGIVDAVARKVGCAWHTARNYIDEHPTVKQAWDNERRRITDQAQRNVIKAIAGGDLQMSKWWLQVMEPEFREVQRHEVEVTEQILIRLDV